MNFLSAEIQDHPNLLDEQYSPFHAEFGMRPQFDFGDFMSRDDMPGDRLFHDDQFL
jgi:hypothetical protein